MPIMVTAERISRQLLKIGDQAVFNGVGVDVVETGVKVFFVIYYSVPVLVPDFSTRRPVDLVYQPD